MNSAAFNTRDHFINYTPLHIAVKNRQTEMVELLLPHMTKEGLNVQAHRGGTIYDMANLNILTDTTIANMLVKTLNQ